jgi:intracellular sulfur oxidation DsrE/DsrF family protein
MFLQQEGILMVELHNSIPRRGFLGSVAKGAAALGLTGLTLPLAMQAGESSAPDASADAGFDAWLNKITGKHKQVYDTPAWNNGLPFAWSRVFLMTNVETGTPVSDVSVVVVLRHEAIPLGMHSPLWEKYKFGESFKIHDPEKGAPLTMNPFYQPKEGSLPLPGMSIDALQKDGVLFGICNMALTFYSMKFAKELKVEAAEIKKDWVAGLLPGIQIVPSGVLAVNRTQERGCTYCFAG